MTAALEIAERFNRRHEGEVKRGDRHVVYDDATGQPIGPGSLVRGHPTAGIGRALDTNGLSDDEATMLFRNSLTVAERAAAAFGGFAWRDLSDVRQAAVISMAFQLGPAGLMGFRQMRLALEAGDFAMAADEALDSAWSRQTPDRAQEVAAMLRTDMEVAA